MLHLHCNKIEGATMPSKIAVLIDSCERATNLQCVHLLIAFFVDFIKYWQIKSSYVLLQERSSGANKE